MSKNYNPDKGTPRGTLKSQREVMKAYYKLMEEVETNMFYKIDLTNRINCYVCSCGHITKTKDVDAGVIPMMHNCESCDAFAYSTGFKDVAPDQPHTQEWYRPTIGQTLKLRKNPGLLEHVLAGGLNLRKL